MNKSSLSPSTTQAKVLAGLAKRQRQERRFRAYGIASVLFALLCLALLFSDILGKGLSAFRQTVLTTQITLAADALGVTSADSPSLAQADYRGLLRQHAATLATANTRQKKRELNQLFSIGGEWQLQQLLQDNPELLGQQVTVALIMDDEVDQWFKHYRHNSVPSKLSEQQISWLEHWAEQGQLGTQFNWLFFTHGDSREPELAGIRGAMMGTFWTVLVTLALSLPMGIAAALYLEEFAPKNRLTEFIEVNINNLAAVPSIIFGLLGLAVFINLFGLPRSTPLVGGLVLTLMTLPTMIISSRAAIKSVPYSLREAAYGLGASKMQTVFHHVFPQALPGMLTGAIIGMAQALGETAPLLMIGMVAFIVDVPQMIGDSATVLPVQIFLWADSPERAFMERTSGAIIVLLGFLIVMNSLAVWLRRRLEKRW